MKECVICKKTISGDHDLCDDHRDLLIAIIDASNKDSEMRRRWESVLELIRHTGYSVTASDDDDDVFKFIEEVKAENK
jgi:hypothetical protein